MGHTKVSTKAVVAGTVSGVLATGAAAGWMGAAVYLARKVVTPERDRPDDTAILALTADTITLGRTAETVVRGRYGLFFDGGEGHLRFGEILADDPQAGSVVREMHGVDAGTPHPGTGRFHSYYYSLEPSLSVGLATHHITIPSQVGPLPAWVVPAPDADLPRRRWAILVHGRGAARDETVRAMRTLHERGFTSLAATYRNDPDAPASSDGRYGLGLSEWQDVDAAIHHALAEGAEQIVLVGWSMGGAIVLQTLVNSAVAERISKVVLDGPVVDWSDVLFHHAREMKVPTPLTALSLRLLAAPPARHLVGVHSAIDLSSTDFVARAGEIPCPVLIIHSLDDEFVPSGPGRRLAAERPDLVTFVPWREARHCKEWNVDPQRWSRVVGEFVDRP